MFWRLVGYNSQGEEGSETRFMPPKWGTWHMKRSSTEDSGSHDCFKQLLQAGGGGVLHGKSTASGMHPVLYSSIYVTIHPSIHILAAYPGQADRHTPLL